MYRTKAKRREAESLIGKLQFVAKCVKAGRVFLSRLINWIRGMDRRYEYSIPTEARKDIAWWGRFIEEFNGVSLIWLHKSLGPDTILASDACLEGFGAFMEKSTSEGSFQEK